MANVKVSDEFNKFYGRAASAVEEAKKAENTMASSPTPVGWKGQVVLLGATADVSKEKKDQSGKVTGGGNPWVRIEFGIVGDEKYQGKKFSLFHIFFDSEKASAGDRFTWFLNECENLGVPREIREGHETLAELLNALVELEGPFEAECVADSYASDGKKMRVRKSAEAVDTSASMAPPSVPPGSGVATAAGGTPDTSKQTPTTNNQDPKIGDKVDYLGKQWEVMDRDGDHLQIKHPERPDTIRPVTLEQLG